MSGFRRISTKRAALLASTALCMAPFLAVLPAAAQDATWLNAPGSADYNDAANWSPVTVPTGTAFFDTSATTSLSIGTATVGGWTFNAGASNYSFTNSGIFEFSGAGIAVNGGSATITNNNVLDFYNTSTAGSAAITNGNTLRFRDSSSAGGATITNNSTLEFLNTSTAGGAGITNSSNLQFFNTASAGNATIVNNDFVGFNDASSAGSAAITNFAGLRFRDTSSAGSAAIINNDFVGFNDASSAGSATLTNANVAFVQFLANSTAGSATIANGGNLQFQLSSTAGSAAITNNGFADFLGSSTALTATITNFNTVRFQHTSSAGSATITNTGAGSLEFYNTSSASSANIANNAFLLFSGASSAGTATIVNNSVLQFFNTSTAGNAAITNGALGNTDFSFSTGPASDNKLSAGSLAGGGTFNLGARELTVGGNNLSTSVTGVIADGGGGGGTGAKLIKTGTGTMTLSGANTYTGGTTISAGTLQIGNGGTTGSVLGNITNNAALIFNRSDAVAFGGNIGGSGTLEKLGAGTLTLSGSNTYGGGTTISAGTLQIGNGGTSGSVLGNITNNAALIFNRSDAVTFGGAIGGSGTLEKLGGGTLTLSGINTYTGATTVTGGTLEISGSIASGTVTNNANLAYIGTATAGSAGITNNSNLKFFDTSTAGSATIVNDHLTYFVDSSSGGSARLIANAGSVFDFSYLTSGGTTAGSFEGDGRFSLGSQTLTVGGNGRSTTVSGIIADGGDGGGTGGALVKTGAGMMTLSGINTYTGATTVEGGTLRVDGSIAASSGVTVNNGGTLTGLGAVGNTAINSGGTLAAGNGTAGSSINVTGSLALQASAFYMVQINPTTSSFANVTGAATLGGSTVQAHYANGSYVARQYTILTAGSINGTFASVVDTNLPANFHTTLSYDATHAYLNLILNFGIPGNINGNQQAVGNALTNFFNTTGGIPVVFSALTPAGLTQASGETATGSQQTTFNAMNQFMGMMTDPFTAGRSDGANAPAYADEADSANAYASSGKPRSKSEREAYAAIYRKAPFAKNYDPRWSVWGAGFGGSQTTDGNVAAGSNNTTSRLFGVAAGADHFFSPNTVAGFALAGGGTNFSVANGGSGRSDLFQAGAFIRHTTGAAYLTGALAYGWQDVTTDRTVTIAGIDRLRAQFNANAFSGRAEAGYRFVSPWIGGVGITPYAAGQFTTFELPAYAEQVVSGTNTFALAYGSKSITASRSELGFRAAKSFAMTNAILTLRGRAAWAHDFNSDRAVAATFQTLPGASFVVNGARQAGDSALTTASAEVKWMNGFSLAGTFEGEFSNVTRSYAGKGVARYSW